MVFEMVSQSWFATIWVVAAIILVSGLAVLTGGSARAESVVPRSQSEMLLSFAPLVRDVAPAVVNVYTKRVVQERPSSPLFNDPFFKQFFGNRFGSGIPQERVEQSLGSGVIVGADGIIVTNNHVVAHGDTFTIALADRREYEATLVLADERTDLAILKIDYDGPPLPAMNFRDSDTLEVGDLVLAIGNPFGVGQTVTSGIVSALARTQVGATDYQFFIQTDAAINPGNSGGALVTMDGQLVGINTAIFSQSGGSVGIGFAIPSNMVRAVVDAAVGGTGGVERPWLAASLQDVTSDLAESLGLDRPGGALIQRTYPGGAAERAGLRSGDVIHSVEGREVIDPQAVRYRLATKSIGGRIEVGYRRNGRSDTTGVELEAAPESPERDMADLEGRHPFSGATVGNLSPAFAEELRIDPFLTGVVVLRIVRGSAAHRLRIQPGDIIRAIAGNDVDTVDELQRLTDGRRSEWEFTIERGGERISARVRG